MVSSDTRLGLSRFAVAIRILKVNQYIDGTTIRVRKVAKTRP